MNRRITWAALWLCAILAAACAAPPAVPPPNPPTPVPLRIQFAPVMRPLLPALRTCLQTLPQLSPQVDERPPTRLEPQAADLTLWWGTPPPESGFAFLLGYDSLQAAYAPQSAAGELTPLQVAALYRSGQPPQGESDSPLPLQVWTYPRGHPLRLAWENALLQGASTTTLARIAPHPQAMREALENSPQAIGFLPGMWLEDSLSRLPLDLPAQAVVVLAPAEPQGATRNLLACWQTRLTETLLSRSP